MSSIGETKYFKKLIIQEIAAHKRMLIEVGISSFVMSLMALGISLYSMQIYDRVIPTKGHDTLIVLASGVMLALALELIIKVSRSMILDRVTSQIDLNLSDKIYEQLIALKLEYVTSEYGNLIGQLRSYEQIRVFATTSTLFAMVDLPLALLFLLAIVAIGGVAIGAVPLVFIMVLLLAGYFFSKKMLSNAQKSQNASNRKLGLAIQTVEKAELIHAEGADAYFKDKWSQLNALSISSDADIKSSNEKLNYITALLTQLCYVAIVSFGAWLAVNGDLTSGAVVACSILSGRAMTPFAAVPQLLVQQAQAKIGLMGLDKFFSIESNRSENKLNPPVLNASYRVENCTFAYVNSTQKKTIEIHNLNISPGEKVGIMGPIGAGKSTILKLLKGLYSPTEGKILIDNLDIGLINEKLLAQKISYLPQESKLIEGTIMKNLTVGRDDYDAETIYKIAKATNLRKVLANNPMGLEMPVNEAGTGLSGGQKQLVAFTRVLVNASPILLLDEPTSSLDPELERNCIRLLAEHIAEANRTLVLVTHKTELLSLVNRLIVVIDGKIVLDGPRDEVLNHMMSQVSNISATKQ